LAGIRLNGGEWYPGGGAKQDDITGWGINAGMLARVCVPEKRTGRLPAPKDEGLPPRVSTCASQRLDRGDKLGEGASKHTTAPQLDECTTARHGRNDNSARYGELKAKPSCACMHASARKPLRVYWAWSGGARQNAPRDNGVAKLAGGRMLRWPVNR
jgi:hypothetical protein